MIVTEKCRRCDAYVHHQLHPACSEALGPIAYLEKCPREAAR